jgi:hypothetical protein
MLYLIGGCPRAGKTLLSDYLLREKNAAPLHIDSYVYFVERLSNDFAEQVELGWNEKLGIGVEYDIERRAQNLLEPTIALVRDALSIHESVVAESDTIFPSHIARFADEFGTDNIRACFLGMENPELDEILKYEGGDAWLGNQNAEMHDQYMDWFRERTEMIKDECREFDQNYVDMTASSWGESFENAVAVLS